jgi:hypothetical protein
MSEVRNFHPLVMEWLSQNNYAFEYEYKLPDFGRVDFYATHADGHKLLIEAKLSSSPLTMPQIFGYGVQVPDARLAIAFPEGKISKRLREVCKKYNIQLIEILTGEASNGAESDMGQLNWNSLRMRPGLMERYTKLAQEMGLIPTHFKKGQSAVKLGIEATINELLTEAEKKRKRKEDKG